MKTVENPAVKLFGKKAAILQQHFSPEGDKTWAILRNSML